MIAASERYIPTKVEVPRSKTFQIRNTILALQSIPLTQCVSKIISKVFHQKFPMAGNVKAKFYALIVLGALLVITVNVG